ncbi:hypothetical protein B0H14DRAFT_3140531 [Mycena olivaceomarginata]|nr:hypothetical protein B0H14DRAFT_3140531 [Mycena olivaceomarginata]
MAHAAVSGDRHGSTGAASGTARVERGGGIERAGGIAGGGRRQREAGGRWRAGQAEGRGVGKREGGAIRAQTNAAVAARCIGMGGRDGVGEGGCSCLTVWVGRDWAGSRGRAETGSERVASVPLCGRAAAQYGLGASGKAEICRVRRRALNAKYIQETKTKMYIDRWPLKLGRSRRRPKDASSSSPELRAPAAAGWALESQAMLSSTIVHTRNKACTIVAANAANVPQWFQGNVYLGSSKRYLRGAYTPSGSQPNALIDGSGAFFSRSRPQYETYKDIQFFSIWREGRRSLGRYCCD